jgi:hypothetical protein
LKPRANSARWHTLFLTLTKNLMENYHSEKISQQHFKTHFGLYKKIELQNQASICRLTSPIKKNRTITYCKVAQWTDSASHSMGQSFAPYSTHFSVYTNSNICGRLPGVLCSVSLD